MTRTNQDQHISHYYPPTHTVIALILHANFTPFIDQLDNTFFLTLFPLPQDFHDNHEIPEEHIHFSDIQQTPTTNPTGGEGALTQWVHCEFIVSFEAIRPVITQQVCGEFF